MIYLFNPTSARGNTEEPEGQQHTDIQQDHEYEGRSGQDVVVCEEDEGLHKTKAGSQVVLQSKVLLPLGRPARRVLTHGTQRDEKGRKCRFRSEDIKIYRRY